MKTEPSMDWIWLWSDSYNYNNNNIDIGRRITQTTDDHRESVFLFQRLSVLIRRYSAVAVLGTFTQTTCEDSM